MRTFKVLRGTAGRVAVQHAKLGKDGVRLRRLRAAGVALVALLTMSAMLVASASAQPTVKFEAHFVPIAGFPNTGNIFKAGAALEAEYTIEGMEYDFSPPPLIGLNLYPPDGTVIKPDGFPKCKQSVLETTGPSGCPEESAAGPVGNVHALISFGGERVDESATLESFYAPRQGLEFFADGQTPESLEIPAAGHFVNLGGHGPELVTEWPLISTEPGAPYVSFASIHDTFGSARTRGAKTHYYMNVPSRCRTGHFPFKAELIFAENGEPSKPITVTATYDAACPGP